MKAADLDPGLDTLLDLHGETLFVDESWHWVKFRAMRTDVTVERPHGLNYSLTLHARMGPGWSVSTMRHPVRERRGPGVDRRRQHDHRHRLQAVRGYEYRNAATLLEDFWTEADSVLKERGSIP